MGGKYGQGYRYATHITKVFVKRTKLFLQCRNLKIQHFRLSQSHPSIVFTRSTCDSPENKYNLFKHRLTTNQFSTDQLPPVLIPRGLSIDRAQYLHKEIRPFVRPDFRDILCPSPA